jgi:hypothetical protein
MSKLQSSDYNNVLDLIEAVYATPNVPGVSRLRGALLCGYTTTNIIASLRLVHPENTMTDEQVNDLLVRGSRSGVFSIFCTNAVDTQISECDDAGVGQPLYHVSHNMVRRNPANAVYASAFNPPATKPDLSIGCGGVNAPINASGTSHYSVFTSSGSGAHIGTNC